MDDGAATDMEHPLALRKARGARRQSDAAAAPSPLPVPGEQRSRLPLWIVSWLQVGPVALILLVLFVLPTGLFLVVSFFDYDRVGIYPAFLLDNYHDLLTTPATWRVYISSLKFAMIVWAITLLLDSTSPTS